VKGEDQLKSALMLSLHSSLVLLLGTRHGFWPTACWIRITSKMRQTGGWRRTCASTICDS
jgi:hypothetical protein